MGAPDRIYLQWHGDADPADYPNGPDPSLDDVTWCADKIYEHDIEYVPANEVTRLRAELAVARSELAVSVGHLSRLAEAYGCDDFTSAIDAALAAKGET